MRVVECKKQNVDSIHFKRLTMVSHEGEHVIVSSISTPEPSEYGGSLYESAILICDEEGFVRDVDASVLTRLRTDDKAILQTYHGLHVFLAAELLDDGGMYAALEEWGRTI